MAHRRTEEQLDGVAIADTSIRQPVFITMLMLLTIVIGSLAYVNLPVNLLPDFSIPIVAVVVSYPGAGPDSVAEQVSKPIEDTINTINGVKHITSNSSEGVAQIIVEFETEVNVDRAEQDVREKVNAVLPRLPRDVRDPTFLKFDPNDAPIITMAVASQSRSPLELRQLVDDEIVPRIQQVEGVGSVDVNGGQVRQINVQMDLDKLKAYAILPVQLTNVIRDANTDFGLGSINAGERDINLRAPSLLQTPEDIARIRITGTPFRVGDVATIEDGVAEVQSYARLDGRDAITLAIRKQSGTNTVAVADNVRAQIEDLFGARPDLIYFIPQDQSEAVRSSTESAIEELLMAALAALLVVFVFFRDPRNTLVTIAGLPIILIGTFAALQFFGLSINLITLLALSLSVGLVIDDAIVVRENIFRHMERGESPRVASSRGTAQVSLSVLAMTLTIIAVFLPVTFSTGITGIIFKSFGITVASAMAISLVEAFTFAPMLSAYLFKQRAKPHGAAPHPAQDKPLSDADEALEEMSEDPGWMGRIYGRILHWSLVKTWHRFAVVGVAIAVLVVSGLVATQLKFQFFPAQDTHEFNMGFQLPPGTPLAQTDELARRAEAILLDDPVIEAVQTTVGGAGSAEKASFFVKLKGTTPTLETQNRLRPELDFLPGLVFGQPSFQGSGTDVTNRPLQVSIQTTRPVNDLIPVLQTLQSEAQTIPGLADIDSTFKPGKPELRFYADPAKIGDLGITNDNIASSVRALIDGDRATVFRQNGQDVDVVVRLRPGDRASADDIRAISVPTQAGNVPLSSLVTVELATSPTTIRRYDRLNQVLIGANVVDRNLLEVQRDIEQRINEVKPSLPTELANDITISFTGQTQQTQEGFGTLLVAMGLSVLFVYMVLASQFGSFLQPLVIMLAMPFSFIGAFIALLLTGIELDITGMIGLIMLLGLVTKNSILLVDFTNRLRRAGLDKHLALERSGAIRLRPILMTTSALVVGALPVALGIHVFGSGEGTEFRRGLAIVLIGGLLTSMFLTLLVVPVAYSLLDSATTRLKGLFRRRQPAARETPADAPVLAYAGASADGHGSSYRGDSGSAHTNATDEAQSTRAATDFSIQQQKEDRA